MRHIHQRRDERFRGMSIRRVNAGRVRRRGPHQDAERFRTVGDVIDYIGRTRATT